jgi:hypothetical protein
MLASNALSTSSHLFLIYDNREDYRLAIAHSALTHLLILLS